MTKFVLHPSVRVGPGQLDFPSGLGILGSTLVARARSAHKGDRLGSVGILIAYLLFALGFPVGKEVSLGSVGEEV